MYSLENLQSCLKDKKLKYDNKNTKFTIKWTTDNAQIAFNYRFTEIPIEKTLNLEANFIIS